MSAKHSKSNLELQPAFRGAEITWFTEVFFSKKHANLRILYAMSMHRYAFYILFLLHNPPKIKIITSISPFRHSTMMVIPMMIHSALFIQKTSINRVVWGSFHLSVYLHSKIRWVKNTRNVVKKTGTTIWIAVSIEVGSKWKTNKTPKEFCWFNSTCYSGLFALNNPFLFQNNTPKLGCNNTKLGVLYSSSRSV